ncbi:MAG TPA: hypothetical protein VJ044_09320 [Candidatus Hodarchaeales archaeon]|nr:hypothetical protein [Candidatus Hodarchaeales archaeon]
MSRKRRMLSERDTFLKWLSEVREETISNGAIVLVEGRRDREFFLYFGFPINNVLAIAGLTEESLKNIAKEMKWRCFIPLVDFDRAGRKYFKAMKGLESLCAKDLRFRRLLGELLRGRIKAVEDLRFLAERLRLAPEDLEKPTYLLSST